MIAKIDRTHIENYEKFYYSMMGDLREKVRKFVNGRDRFKGERKKIMKSVYNSFDLLFLDKNAVESINKWTRWIFHRDTHLLSPDSSHHDFKKQKDLLYRIIGAPHEFFTAFLKESAGEFVDQALAADLIMEGDLRQLEGTIVYGSIALMVKDLEKTYNEGIVDYMAYKFLIEAFEGKANLKLHIEMLEKGIVKGITGYKKQRTRILRNKELRGRIGFAHFMVKMAEKMGYIKLVN
jgi:hypothetical protein